MGKFLSYFDPKELHRLENYFFWDNLNYIINISAPKPCWQLFCQRIISRFISLYPVEYSSNLTPYNNLGRVEFLLFQIPGRSWVRELRENTKVLRQQTGDLQYDQQKRSSCICEIFPNMFYLSNIFVIMKKNYLTALLTESKTLYWCNLFHWFEEQIWRKYYSSNLETKQSVWPPGLEL